MQKLGVNGLCFDNITENLYMCMCVRVRVYVCVRIFFNRVLFKKEEKGSFDRFL